MGQVKKGQEGCCWQGEGGENTWCLGITTHGFGVAGALCGRLGCGEARAESAVGRLPGFIRQRGREMLRSVLYEGRVDAENGLQGGWMGSRETAEAAVLIQVGNHKGLN